MTTDGEFRRGRHMVSAMHVHLLFVTKYRRDVFNDDMLTVSEATMRKVCEDLQAELTEFNGEDDHVHLLVHYPPKVAASALVNSLKGVSARILRRDFTSRANPAITHGPLWSPSYFAASCGDAPLTVVRQYIEQQRQPLQLLSADPSGLPRPEGQGLRRAHPVNVLTALGLLGHHSRPGE